MPPKYRLIADEIKNEIVSGKYAASKELPTEYMLVDEYAASRQTIRRALAQLVDEGMISRRQGSGTQILRRTGENEDGNRLSVAIVTTYISDYIFPSILREAENVLSGHNCTLSIFATQNEISNERRVLKQLLDSPVDGVLVEGTKTALPNPNQDLYRQLISKGIPLVFIHGNYANLPEALSVLDDNENGGRMLVDHLRKKGHRNIAGVFKSDDIQGPLRYEGYTQALCDADININDKCIAWYNTETKGDLLSGGFASYFDYILEECTAVICFNDEIAGYVVGYFREKGVAIPEDIAVVSFDNSWYSEYAPVRITSLSHGEYNAGRSAAELLIRLLNGEVCQSEKLPWILMEKESS
ncbi:MAG: substrate-binding domain-containing protein [Clostridiales bacterium]|nr:substrate-binding domain-containing protein [Clostridiales bacterium]